MCRAFWESSCFKCRWVGLRTKSGVGSASFAHLSVLTVKMSVRSHESQLVFIDPCRAMYWTHQDYGDLGIVSGGMDGTWLKILKNRGLKRPTSVAIHYRPSKEETHVYWVDAVLARIEHIALNDPDRHGFLDPSEYAQLVPQRITIIWEQTYYVGISANGSSRVIYTPGRDPLSARNNRSVSGGGKVLVAGDFSQVTGLSIYDADSQVPRRTNSTCAEGHPCAGICLLSGKDSYRCACPIGFESHGLNGSSCRGLLPSVFTCNLTKSLSTANFTTMTS